MTTVLMLPTLGRRVGPDSGRRSPTTRALRHRREGGQRGPTDPTDPDLLAVVETAQVRAPAPTRPTWRSCEPLRGRSSRGNRGPVTAGPAGRDRSLWSRPAAGITLEAC
ncbi:hypothetical protein GCM10023162_32450 [Klenkia terrae]